MLRTSIRRGFLSGEEGVEEKKKNQKGKEGKYCQISPSVTTAATEDDKKAAAASAWPNPVFKAVKITLQPQCENSSAQIRLWREAVILYLQTSQQW